MLKALDVVAYILEKKKIVTAMKLQKLLYYCQAWSLVWDEKPLFKEKIEAWANGPVVREIYESFRGQFYVKSASGGDADKLNPTQQTTVNAILKYYGFKSAQWLSDLTHMEVPWKEARKGISEGESGCKEISPFSMAEYYSSLPEQQ